MSGQPTAVPFEYLQQWYSEQCDGDWEHQFGVAIETLDNPGWSITIDLVRTSLEGQKLESILSEQSNDLWVAISSDGEKLKIACGPLCLEQALTEFQKFVEA